MTYPALKIAFWFCLMLGAFVTLASVAVEAADIPVKAPVAVPPATPLCSVTQCSGFYAGAFIGGVGSNADIIGSGLAGSVFAGGETPGFDVGWQYWNGALFFAAEVGGGWQMSTTVSANGVGGNENGWLAYELLEVGGDLAGLTGSGSNPITIPTTLASHLIAPYVAIGSVQRGFGTGWASGAGAKFDLTSNVMLDLRYLYVNYGSATNGALNLQSENLILLGADYVF